jgi:hypothetical protein
MISSTPVEDQIDAHTVARAALVLQIVRVVTDIVGAFDDWYSTDDITKMTKRIVGEVEASQRATAAVTDAYLSHVASDISGKRVPPAGAVKVDGLRAGITHEGVYGRLADQYRYRITLDEEPDAVLESVVQRAAVMAETDTDLAFRAQATRNMLASNATGYRRIIRPERSLFGSCGLCVVASTRVYRKAELLELHGRCKCTVLPIIGSADPGKELNGEDLKAIYAAVGSTQAYRLAHTRVTVRENGEQGPVLTRSGDKYRDAKQVRKDSRDVGVGKVPRPRVSR